MRRWQEAVHFICDSALRSGLPQIEHTGDKLLFHLPNGAEFACPVPCAPAANWFPSLSTVCGSVHGNVGIDSLLVSPQGYSWLLDFGSSGARPILIDYVRFEGQIALDLVEGIGLAEWHDVAARPLAMDRLDARLDGRQRPIERKALAAIGKIRINAFSLVGIDIRP